MAMGVAATLQLQRSDYIPAYRSEAGTGIGLAFALWRESLQVIWVSGRLCDQARQITRRGAEPADQVGFMSDTAAADDG